MFASVSTPATHRHIYFSIYSALGWLSSVTSQQECFVLTFRTLLATYSAAVSFNPAQIWCLNQSNPSRWDWLLNILQAANRFTNTITNINTLRVLLLLMISPMILLPFSVDQSESRCDHLWNIYSFEIHLREISIWLAYTLKLCHQSNNSFILLIWQLLHQVIHWCVLPHH